MKSHSLKSILAFASAVALNAVCYGDHHKKPVDLAGVWNVTASSDNGDRELTWTIKKESDKLTGTSVDGESGDERNLDRIKVEEKKVTIEVDVEQDGNTGIIKVVAEEKESGTLTGKWSIEGSDGSELMSGDLTAAKQFKIAYAGDWHAVTVLPDGGEMSVPLKLTGENASLKGAFNGENGALEIDKITAEERSLRLAFDMEIQGNPADVVIEADLKEENKLAGKWIVKGPDGGEAATGDWSATREPKLDIAGDWNVTAALPDGGEYIGTVSIASDGDKYTGKSKSSNGDEREIKTVSVDGKDVVLTLNFERDGENGLLTITAEHKEDGSLEGKWSLAGADGIEVLSDSWSASKDSKGRGVVEGR